MFFFRFRRKLLKSLTPKNRRILHMWDPEVIALKQQVLIDQVYGMKCRMLSVLPVQQNIFLIT